MFCTPSWALITPWRLPEGETNFRWSVWRDGYRIQMGSGPHSTAEDCEVEALDFCWRELGSKPDKVTRL